MKKIIISLLSCITAITLAGCADASAKLSDGKTSVLTINGKDYTKNDVYEIMEAQNGATQAVTNVKDVIANIEITETDEMKENAQSQLDIYKTYYGDSFVANQGFSSDEDYINYMINIEKNNKLYENYINTEWTYVIEKYKPYQIIIGNFSTSDDANNALTLLNTDDSDIDTIFSENNSSSNSSHVIITNPNTNYSDAVTNKIYDKNSTNGTWQLVDDSANAAYYVFKVLDTNPDDFKEDAIQELSSLEGVQNDSDVYYFKKYAFHIYDANLYDNMSRSYPDLIVQRQNEENDRNIIATPAVESTPDAKPATSTDSPSATSTSETSTASPESN